SDAAKAKGTVWLSRLCPDCKQVDGGLVALPGRTRLRGRSCGGGCHVFFVMRDAVRTGGSIAIARRRNFHLFAQRGFNFFTELLVLLQEHAGILAALAHAFPTKADPRAGLFQDALFHAEINEVAFTRNALSVENVELGFAERCRYL